MREMQPHRGPDPAPPSAGLVGRLRGVGPSALLDLLVRRAAPDGPAGSAAFESGAGSPATIDYWALAAALSTPRGEPEDGGG